MKLSMNKQNVNKKMKSKPGMVVHTFSACTQEAEGFSELEASLFYIARSRTAKAAQRSPLENTKIRGGWIKSILKEFT